MSDSPNGFSSRHTEVLPRMTRVIAQTLGYAGLDLDAVWNLAPAHAACNVTKSNALPTRDQVARLARRNAAIMNSPHPLRRTLEITLRTWESRGRPGGWPRFLAGVTER